jgi:hypothetical protein
MGIFRQSLFGFLLGTLPEHLLRVNAIPELSETVPLTVLSCANVICVINTTLNLIKLWSHC